MGGLSDFFGDIWDYGKDAVTFWDKSGTTNREQQEKEGMAAAAQRAREAAIIRADTAAGYAGQYGTNEYGQALGQDGSVLRPFVATNLAMPDGTVGATGMTQAEIDASGKTIQELTDENSQSLGRFELDGNTPQETTGGPSSDGVYRNRAPTSTTSRTPTSQPISYTSGGTPIGSTPNPLKGADGAWGAAAGKPPPTTDFSGLTPAPLPGGTGTATGNRPNQSDLGYGLIPDLNRLYIEGALAPAPVYGEATSAALAERLQLAEDFKNDLIPQLQAQIGSSYLEGLSPEMLEALRQTTGVDQGTRDALMESQVSGFSSGIMDRFEDVADVSTRVLQEQLQRETLPEIGQGAIQAGMYGSSRQGIAEGLATSEAQKNIADVHSNIMMQGILEQTNRELAEQGQRIGEQGQFQNFQTALASLDQSELENLRRFEIANLGSEREYEMAQQGIDANLQAQLAQMMGIPADLIASVGSFEDAILNAENAQQAHNLRVYQELLGGILPGSSITSTTVPPALSPVNAALGGAAAGSSFGPWGAVVGGGLGLASSYLQNN